MRILRVTTREDAVRILADLRHEEFRKLRGHLSGLHVVATQRIRHPASAIRTGKRGTWAKWLLLPVSLRRRYRTSEYNFDSLRCYGQEHRAVLIFSYAIPRKNQTLPLGDEDDD